MKLSLVIAGLLACAFLIGCASNHETTAHTQTITVLHTNNIYAGSTTVGAGDTTTSVGGTVTTTTETVTNK